MLEEQTPAQAAIFWLPVELLHEILELAALHPLPHRRFWGRLNKATIKTLTLVCRLFRTIAQPLMVHNIGASHRNIAELLILGKSNPSLLRNHCRDLSMTLSEDMKDKEYIAQLKELVSQLHAVRSLCLWGLGQEPPVGWTVIPTALHNMPRLEYISNVTSLRTLDLQNIERPQAQGPDENSFLDTMSLQSAPIISPRLSVYEETSEALERLIKWPKSLIKFGLKEVDIHDLSVDLPTLTSWLHMHKDSLEEMETGPLSFSGTRLLFDATAFVHLKRLTLSWWQVCGYKEQRHEDLRFRQEVADLLLAPSLITIVFDFQVEREGLPDWPDFQEPEERWLRQLARAAISKKAALRTIGIIFYPSLDGDLRKEYGYPWDCMYRLDNLISKRGMSIGHTEPPVPESVWLNLVHVHNVSSPDDDSEYDSAGYDFTDYDSVIYDSQGNEVDYDSDLNTVHLGDSVVYDSHGMETRSTTIQMGIRCMWMIDSDMSGSERNDGNAE
ncbi:uncharacterized protein DSM5745_08758 [Aspergillus mulundensis]|uniref:F-box domain-containing protein n=1 Tax=Aspergillus mulundensis TaxID=1810919 RepID=A0A3D8R4V3_9EURO|nr:hypothetical protein DSM5745_08758 [Aspergillus mulundensis]RDW68998.1 hypothetical protein DSM5745_08758 [Aspergillus mulundensis]